MTPTETGANWQPGDEMGYRARHKPGKREELTDRQIRVWELTIAGLSRRKVAAELGVSVGTVQGDYSSASEFYLELSEETAASLRAVENERLDTALEHAVRILGANPEPETKLRAIDRIVRLGERRAKLNGLDAPERIEQLNAELSPEAIAEMTREVFREGVEPKDDAGSDG